MNTSNLSAATELSSGLAATELTLGYVSQMIGVGSVIVFLNGMVLAISLTKKLRSRDYAAFVGHIAAVHIATTVGRCGLKLGIFFSRDAPVADWERVLCPVWIFIARVLSTVSLFAVLPILVQRWATLRSADLGGPHFRPACLAVVWAAALFTGLPSAGLRHSSRQGLGCSVEGNEELGRRLPNTLSGLVLLTHFALVAFFSAMVIRLLKKQRRDSVTENVGRLREMGLVAKVAASQAAVPLLLFLPLLCLVITGMFIDLPAWPLLAARELVCLTSAYDPVATLAILGPYRKALRTAFRRANNAVEDSDVAAQPAQLMRHQEQSISTF